MAKKDKRGKHSDMYELPAWAQLQLAFIWQLHHTVPTCTLTQWEGQLQLITYE